MSWWRQLTGGLRVLVRRDAADADLADEVQHFLDEATAAHLAAGLPADAARRAARLDVGNASAVRDEVRASAWEHLLDTTVADVVYAARRLRADRAFAIVSVLTLALGIGATAAIFSAIKPILAEPLPYPHPERILTIADLGQARAPIDVTFGTFRELAARTRSFESLAVMKPWLPTLTGQAEPERLEGQRVSAGYLRVLGLAPSIGRDLDASDDREGGPSVVILSDRLWRRLFNADPSIAGRPIVLDDNAFTIAGVMPPFENVLAPSADVWAPLQYATAFTPLSREWGHHLRLLGRLRAGAGIERARRELDEIARSPRPEFARVPWASLGRGLLARPLGEDVAAAVRPALLAVLGAVLVLLAIACVNVTNLLLARGGQRRGELAMRMALGAGRGRMVRQLLTESLLVALAGGALGMALAHSGVRVLVALSPPDLPRLSAIRVDAGVFAFALAVTGLAGIAVGVVPALSAARGDLRPGTQESSRRTAGGRTRGALAVAEVALALVLLVGAGLLLRSLQRVFAVNVGFDASHLLTLEVQESGRRYRADSARHAFFERALEAVGRVPGVSSAAFTSLLPLGGAIDVYGVHLERDRQDGATPGLGTNDGGALRYAVTPGYFETLHIPIRRGRLLTAYDTEGAQRAAVINESFAKREFAAVDPIGQRLLFGPDEGQWYTIVGVVGDVKQASLATAPQDAIYITPRQWHWGDMVRSLVVRSSRDPAALVPEIRRAIWSVDKDLPIVRVATMDEIVTRAAAQRRFVLTLFEAFALAALTLAAIGIYGVLSGRVTERTREIGVRSALGASRADILALVARQGLTLTTIGSAIGLAGSFAASRALTSLLFDISPLDPMTYAGVIALLAAVSACACGAPAWKAARVDPSVALRSE